MFPSVTLCPFQDKNPLMNIKIDLFRANFNLSDYEIKGFAILPTFLKPEYNLSHILDEYSYSRKESFVFDGQFM